MITRSQSKKIQEQQELYTKTENIKYVFEIDFDEASREWNANKIRVGQMYSYICGIICKNGNRCKRQRMKSNEYCFMHKKE